MAIDKSVISRRPEVQRKGPMDFTRELARKAKEQLRVELSPTAEMVWRKYVDELNAYGQTLHEHMSGEGSDPLLLKSVGLESRVAMIRNKLDGQFARLMQRMALNFLTQLSRRDQEYQATLNGRTNPERKALERTYQEELLKLQEEAQLGVAQLDETIRDAVQVAGGENKMLDTFSEADIFNRNFLAAIEQFQTQLQTPEGIVQMGLNSNITNNRYGRALEIIHGKNKGEALTQADYDFVLTNIQPFFERVFTLEKLAQKEEIEAIPAIETFVQGIENTGTLMVVHAMNPRERFELGKAIFRNTRLTPQEQVEGVRFLTAADFLDIEQAQALLKQYAPTARFKREEYQTLRHTQAQVQLMREKAAEFLETEPNRNLILEHGTATNVLLYQVAGHLAAIGMVLPFALSIWRPEEWPHIMTDPAWLACVAVAGGSYNHVTGGSLEEGFAKWGEKARKKPETAEPTEEEWANLGHLMGNHPEATALLRQNDAQLLERIYTLANQEKDPAQYRFTLEKLVQDEKDKMQKDNPEQDPDQVQELAEEVVTTEYGLSKNVEIDGRPLKEIENIITQMVRTLYHDFTAGTPDSMQNTLAKLDQRRGLTH